MLSDPGPQAGHLPQVYAGLEMSCRQRKRARLFMRRHAFLARVRGSTDSVAEPAREASPVPSYLGSLASEEEGCREVSPQAGPAASGPPAGDRKRTHWEKHYPWRFVSPRALNTRGEQIFYPVDDDQDRKWAWRLERALDHHRSVHERALDHHRSVHERDIDEMSDMHARELKELSDGGLLRWRLQRIKELESRIIQMHKNFNNGVGYGL